MSAVRMLRGATNTLYRASRTGRACHRAAPGVLALALTSRRSFWSSASATSAAPVVEELASGSIPHVADSLLPILFAVVLAAGQSDEEDVSPPWDVKQTSKGAGAFANRQLQRGELLIAERPLCCWPQGLSEEQAKELFSQLGENEKKVYLALSRTEGDGPVRELDEIRAIRATNGFALTLPGSTTTAGFVFPKIARINHSCTPNASQAMNYETLRMEVYSIASINPSTEINIEYLPLITSTRAERQAALASSFGFASCLCPTCSASPADVEKSDARRREIKGLGEQVRVGKGDRKGTLAKLERIRVLLDEEGYESLPEFEDPSVSNAYAVYAGMYARSQREA